MVDALVAGATLLVVGVAGVAGAINCPILPIGPEVNLGANLNSVEFALAGAGRIVTGHVTHGLAASVFFGASIHKCAIPRFTQRPHGLASSQDIWAFRQWIHAWHTFRLLQLLGGCGAGRAGWGNPGMEKLNGKFSPGRDARSMS